MHKRAYLGLGFLLALGIVFSGLSTGGSVFAQTGGSTSVTIPGTGGTTGLPQGGTASFAPGSAPAGSVATITELLAPPPGTTLPGVGTVLDFRVTNPDGTPVTAFTGRVTVTGTGNTCTMLNEATGRFEPIQGTPIGGGMIECVLPRPGIVGIVTVTAPAVPAVATPVAPSRPATPAQAPAQAPRAGAAAGQAPSALPRTGESLPIGGVVLAGLLLAGLGVATRRFVRV